MIFKRTFLILSLFCNLLLGLGLFVIVQRLGGLNFAMHRVMHDEAGLYSHRTQLFEMLPPSENALVFLGDSQTEQCEWREFLGNETAIKNRGIVADHVKGVLNRLPKILAEKPRQIVLQVGINDLLQQASVEETAATFNEIVRKIRKDAAQAQLVVVSVFPVNNEVKWVGVENETVKTYNDALKEIANRFAVPYVDVFTNLTDGNGNLNAKYTEDGVHLNGTGYLVWKKALLPLLQ